MNITIVNKSKTGGANSTKPAAAVKPAAKPTAKPAQSSSGSAALTQINKDASKIQKSVPGVTRQDAIKVASAVYRSKK